MYCNFFYELRRVKISSTIIAMKIKGWIQREKYVALHAQPFWFRIVKYIVIIALFTALVLWKGWTVALTPLLCLMATGTVVHFIFRWKTKGWTQSWGPYKKIDIPMDKSK